MEPVRRIDSPFAAAQAGIIRNRDSTSEAVIDAARRIGGEIGRRILEVHFTQPATVVTRLAENLQTVAISRELSVVITTNVDAPVFGGAVAAELQPCLQGTMNFEGRRGLEALNSPVRDMQLPDTGSRPVSAVIVGKSILATGCTAISLTKAAVHQYMPSKIIIATIFYSLTGLQELQQALPNSSIFVVGDPAPLNSDGTLAIGLIEELM
jgi:uracil phosphoribosyltransferase